MSFLELKVPPVAVTLLMAAGMWGVAYAWPGEGLPAMLRYPLACGLVLLGLIVGLAGVVSFRRAGTTVDPRYPDKATAVVRNGIFRFSRNPMYVALLLALAGWAVFLASGLVILFLPLFVFWMKRFQIVPEERILLEKFGREFKDYMQSVRRWL